MSRQKGLYYPFDGLLPKVYKSGVLMAFHSTVLLLEPYPALHLLFFLDKFNG